MHETVAPPAWVMIAYLISGVCFILALRGLSSPQTSQRGNRLGMIGMTIAVLTTLVHYAPQMPTPIVGPAWLEWRALIEVVAAIAVGAGIGIVMARRIAM